MRVSLVDNVFSDEIGFLVGQLTPCLQTIGIDNVFPANSPCHREQFVVIRTVKNPMTIVASGNSMFNSLL